MRGGPYLARHRCHCCFHIPWGGVPSEAGHVLSINYVPNPSVQGQGIVPKLLPRAKPMGSCPCPVPQVPAGCPGSPVFQPPASCHPAAARGPSSSPFLTVQMQATSLSQHFPAIVLSLPTLTQKSTEGVWENRGTKWRASCPGSSPCPTESQDLHGEGKGYPVTALSNSLFPQACSYSFLQESPS